MSGDRSKFAKDSKLIYGLHPEGILEIKFNDSKKKNAFFFKTQKRLGDLFIQANKDPRVKVVVLHGGDFFSAGNDIAVFEIGREDTENVEKYSLQVLKDGLTRLMTTFFELEKPVVAMVKGFAIGLGFTMLSLADFVYCTPETKFFTPFMQSFQSPEGLSSVMFPLIFGRHKANEMIMQDIALTAEEALKSGFVNQILTDFPIGDFFDILRLPCMVKLLQNNVETVQIAKRLLIDGMGRERIYAAIQRESAALHHIWMDPLFSERMMGYLMMINQKPPTKKVKKQTDDKEDPKLKERHKL